MTVPRHRLLVALTAALCFSNVLSAEFTMDDRYNVVENAAIRSLANLPSFFTEAWGARSDDAFDRGINQGYWRPLSTLSFALDYALYGPRPSGFHLTNVLLHVAASVLVLAWLSRLGVGALGALAASLWWAVHPVHTEAVDVVTYRTELLATVAALVGLLVAARPHRPTAGLWLALCYAAGLLSKETAVTLPAWALVVDLLVLRERGAGVLVRRYAPSVLVLGSYLAIRKAMLTTTSVPFFAELDPLATVASVVAIVGLYVRLLLWPWPLIPFYDWSVLPPATGFWEPHVVVGLVAAALVIAACVVSVRRAPHVAAGLACACLGLVPFLHLVPLPVGAGERFLYFASVGAALALGAAIDGALAKRSIRSLVVGVVVVLGTVTLVRNRDWRDDAAIWTAAVRDFPESFNAQLALGTLHLEAGDAAAAEVALEAADRLVPGVPRCVAALADAFVVQGRPSEALARVAAAVARRGPSEALDAAAVRARRALLALEQRVEQPL